MSFVLVLYIAVLLHTVSSQGYIDDACTVKSTRSTGVCKLLSDCQTAQEELQQNRFPQTCGFQETQPIVCCPQSLKPGEISKRKCREYARYMFDVNVTEVNKDKCGHRVVSLIVGGEPAEPKEFPHMAAIGYEPTPGNLKWLCGGTILSDRFILTAAHCLSTYALGDALWVLLGVNGLNDTDYRQQIRIAERAVYPEYRSNSYYHDIGLLKLEKPAEINPYVLPACLYLKPEISAKKAMATGWGDTSYDGEGSNDLLKVTVNLFNQSICGLSYKQQRKLEKGIRNDLQVCAGSINEAKDTCQGDSGGPLQIYHTGDDIKCMYDIIGVTSFGKYCGVKPGVYTRVSYYIKWIEETVWS